MGIQNRNKKDKGKNNVQINVNITEHTPPKVVKIPTKIVKVPKKARTKAPSLVGVSPVGGEMSSRRESDALTLPSLITST